MDSLRVIEDDLAEGRTVFEVPEGRSRIVDIEDIDLSLQVVALRSPHLNRLAKTVEAIANAVGEAIKTGA